jgi:hypothetical protein
MKNRWGLGLLTASCALAALMALLPGLGVAGLAYWMLGLGLAGYVGTVLVVAWPTAGPSAPALRQVRAVRRAIAERLETRRAVDAPFASILADALTHVDDQLMPALERATLRQQALERQIRRYARGELPLPEAEALARLRRLHMRQQAAIEACVRAAANADAALVAMTEGDDDPGAGLEARRWADRLGSAYDALVEVYGSDDEASEPRRLNAQGGN